MSPPPPALRFEGKVAVVTGAGAGIGRQYALDLAHRGAKVVVNDLGCKYTGSGASHQAADEVVKEIQQAGGVAVANYDSVENGEAIIKAAIDAFGRIDILINNAGILRDASFQKLSTEDWDSVYKVHLKGAFTCCKAAWKYMREQRYGRIINVTSAAGLYGNFGQANYSAMKMAVVGLSNTLAREGARYGIHVNTIAPIAGTRMTATIMPEDILKSLRPEYIANIVLYLVHEGCKENGALFELGGGWVGKLRWERSQGVYFKLDNSFNPEKVKEKWSEIDDWTDATHPSTTQDSFQPIMRTINDPLSVPAKSHSHNQKKAIKIFEKIERFVQLKGSDLSYIFDGVVETTIDDQDVWTVNLTKGKKPTVSKSPAARPSLSISMSDETLADIADTGSSVTKLYAQGKIKIQGDLKLAMKLAPLIQQAMLQSRL